MTLSLPCVECGQMTAHESPTPTCEGCREAQRAEVDFAEFIAQSFLTAADGIRKAAQFSASRHPQHKRFRHFLAKSAAERGLACMADLEKELPKAVPHDH